MLQALSMMSQSGRMLGRWLVRLTKGGMKYFEGISQPFCQKTKMSRRWSCPRGIFSISSSKRLPSMVLRRGTSTSGTDLCGLTTSILPAVCTNVLLRGSTNSSADNRPVRVSSLTDSSAVRDSEVKIPSHRGYHEHSKIAVCCTIGHMSTCRLCLVNDEQTGG